MGTVVNYLRNLGSLIAGREPVRPLLFSWHATHRCDLACLHCTHGDGRRLRDDPVPELDTAGARRLISILRPSADVLDLSGGDPLLREDLEEILAHARSIGFRTVLATKGLGLEKRPGVLRHTDILVLAIDALEPDRLAEEIGRPAETAKAMLASLRWILAEGRREGMRVILSAPATPTNLHDVHQVLRLAVENRCGFQVAPLFEGTKVDPALRRSGDWRNTVDDLLEAKRSGWRVLGVPGYYRGIREFGPARCHPLLMPSIRPDGHLSYPCPERSGADVDLVAAGSYEAAIAEAREKAGPIPRCDEECSHLFCHLALGSFQASPLAAMRELRHLRN